jgi:hypothetical protein
MSRTCRGLKRAIQRPSGSTVRSFFGDEVPDRDRSAANLTRQSLHISYLQRLVPAGDRAGVTPQDHSGAGDPSTPTAGLVVLVVECGGGALICRFEPSVHGYLPTLLPQILPPYVIDL